MKCRFVIDKKFGPYLILTDDAMKQAARSLVGLEVEGDDGRIIGKVVSAKFVKNHVDCEMKITDSRVIEMIKEA